MKELDLVKLTVNLPDIPVKAGAIGTIVYVYGDQQHFEVEFKNGLVFTLSRAYLEKMLIESNQISIIFEVFDKLENSDK